MGADRNEHEPDEYDPEAEFRDPDSDSITIPEVSSENAGSNLRSDLQSELDADTEIETDFSTAETDVPPELLKQFWALVLVLNAAILAIALGVLFLVFEGSTYGYYVLALGLVFTGFAIYRYRTVKQTEYDSSGDETDDDQTADGQADGSSTDADDSLEGNTDTDDGGTNTAATDDTASDDFEGT